MSRVELDPVADQDESPESRPTDSAGHGCIVTSEREVDRKVKVG